jgi:enterobactin synthetase component D
MDPLLSFISIPQNLQDACLSRKRDFLTGRLCAHKALQNLSLHDLRQSELPIGPHGEPQWEPGVVGSISHTLDTACAAVGSSRSFVGIGVDLQSYLLFEQIKFAKQTVANKSEQHRDLLSLSEVSYFTLLFSAKESVYKAFFPRERRFMDFADVEITFEDFQRGTFDVNFRGDFSNLNSYSHKVKGYFDFTPSMVKTLVLVMAEHEVSQSEAV